jgi:hypothetical protein
MHRVIDQGDRGAFAQGSAQGTEPEWEYVPTRESRLDAACSAAGPGFAIVAGPNGIRGIVRYDAERGCPLDEIPAEGWVS